jgi:hypothetical protein
VGLFIRQRGPHTYKDDPFYEQEDQPLTWVSLFQPDSYMLVIVGRSFSRMAWWKRTRNCAGQPTFSRMCKRHRTT